MPQFETVEELRRLHPGQAGTLIPSWNTGFALRAEPRPGKGTGGIVRPGQKLHVLAEDSRHYQVRQEADGLVGWIPLHVVTPWPET